MGLIDTHTHLDSFARRGELPATLLRAGAAGLEGMIAIGTDTDDWTLNQDLADSSRRLSSAGLAKEHGTTGASGVTPAATVMAVHYTVGLHPCNVGADWAERVAQLEGFWRGAGLRPALPVALGETGLDRFHLPKEPAEAEMVFGWQKAAFSAQLLLAKRLGCPLVVHSRQAFSECVAMIDAAAIDWSRVVFHCFTEGPAEMAELKRRGGFGSFTGVVTYKNAEGVRAAALAQGLERLMIETDAPFLTPMPLRGKPNEPAFLRHTAEYCAGLFGVSHERLAEVTTANARRFFGLV
jgi:TatD DNase family protein